MDTTATQKSASHLYPKIYDKRGDFIFSIVNFPFINSNILAAPTFHKSCYSRDCAQHCNFVERVQLLTQRQLEQCYDDTMLKSSLQKFYGSHHELVDRSEISNSQMVMDYFPFA